MRHILHADFDAFYTSVEQRDNLALRGKPVVVGGSPEGRGVVASASYEARRYGIRSAMPMYTALQRCPRAIRVPPRFDRYGEVSRQVMVIFREIADLVEPLSLDEAYMDVTDAVTASNTPEDIAAHLRARVLRELGLIISVGVATSKSVAKIASDMNKPDALTVVPPGEEREFLAPLDIQKLPGIGPKTAERLRGDGVNTVAELVAQPETWWAKRFGRTAHHMRRLALGEDRSPVVEHRERKSASAETTLSTDTEDPDMLRELVDRLSQRVARQLDSTGIGGHTVKLKLRLSDFTTFTRQVTLPAPVVSSDEIAVAARSLLTPEIQPGRCFRLVGVGISGFENSDELPHQARLTGF